MTQDLGALQAMTEAVNRWEQPGKPLAHVLENVAGMLRETGVPVGGLRLFRVRGQALRLLGATGEAANLAEMTLPEPASALGESYVEALASGIPIASQTSSHWLVAPVKDGRQHILLEAACDTLDASHATTLTLTARWLSAALERREIHSMLRRQTIISSRLSNSTTFPEIAEALALDLLHDGQVISINLARYDDEGSFSGFRTIATADRHGVRRGERVLELTLGQLGQQMRAALVEGTACIIEDVQPSDLPEQLKRTITGEAIVAKAVLPMRARGRVLGWVGLNDTRASLNLAGTELELLRALADQVAIVIALQNLSEESAVSQQVIQQQALVFNELVAGQDYEDMAQVIKRHMLADHAYRLVIAEMVYDTQRRIESWAPRTGTAPGEQPAPLPGWDTMETAVRNAIIDGEAMTLAASQSAEPGSLAAWARAMEAGAVLVVPISAGHQPIAAMLILHPYFGAINPGMIGALRNIGEMMGALLDVRRLDLATQQAREAVEHLVLANRLITTATSYAYMAQAVMYTLAGGLRAAAVTLFDRPLQSGEQPQQHMLVGLSTDVDVVDLEPWLATAALEDTDLRRLFAGTPVMMDADGLSGLLPGELETDVLPDNLQHAALFGLRSGSRLIGTVALLDEKPIELDDEAVNTFTTMADQVGQAIRSRQLLQESEQQQALASQLVQANYNIAASDDFSDMGRVILNLLPETVIGVAFLLFDSAYEGGDLPNHSRMEAYVTRDNVEHPDIVDPLDPAYPNLKPGLNMLADGEMVIIDDARERNRLSNEVSTAYFAERNLYSFVSVGLRAGRRLLGFLTLAKQVGAQVSPVLLNNLRSVADQAGIATENRRLLRTTERSLREAQTLYHINSELLSASDEADILRVIFEQVPTGTEGAVVMLARAHYGPVSDSLLDLVLESIYTSEGDQQIGHSLSSGVEADDMMRLLSIYNDAHGPRFYKETNPDVLVITVRAVAGCGPIGAGVVLPIFDEAHVTHLFFIDYPQPREFDAQERRLFQAVRDQLEIVMQNQRLLRDLRAAAARLGNQVRVLQTINHISSILTGTLDQQSLLDNTCEALHNALSVDHVVVAMMETPDVLAVVSEYPARGQIGRKLALTDAIQQRLGADHASIMVETMDASDQVDGTTREMLHAVGAQSALMLPLQDTAGDYIGFISLHVETTPQGITENMREIARTITAQIIITLRNIQLLRSTQRQAAQMEQVAQFSRSIQTALDQDSLLRISLERAVEIFDADRAAIHLYDPAAGSLRCRAHWSKGEAVVISGRAAFATIIKQTTAGQVWQTRETLRIDDLTAHEQLRFTEDAADDQTYVRSALALPLFARGIMMGILELGSMRQGAYKATDIAIMQQLVSQIGVALENAEVFQQSRRVAQSKALINEITSRMQQQMDIEQILSVTVNELGQALGARRARIRLSPEALRTDDQTEASS